MKLSSGTCYLDLGRASGSGKSNQWSKHLYKRHNRRISTKNTIIKNSLRRCCQSKYCKRQMHRVSGSFQSPLQTFGNKIDRKRPDSQRLFLEKTFFFLVSLSSLMVLDWKGIWMTHRATNTQGGKSWEVPFGNQSFSIQSYVDPAMGFLYIGDFDWWHKNHPMMSQPK